MPEATFTRRGRWLAAEFVVIVIGILTASVVDDWRQDRRDRASAETALALIAGDLERDSIEIAIFREATREQWEAALALTTLSPELPPDSVLELHGRTSISWNFRPTTSAFQSLQSSGRFELIDDPGLLDDILRYYDDRLVFLDDLRQYLRDAEGHYGSVSGRHVQLRPTAEGGSRWTIVTSVEEMTEDPELRAAASRVASRAGPIQGRFGEPFAGEIGAIRARILER